VYAGGNKGTDVYAYIHMGTPLSLSENDYAVEMVR
jgi:hypothetical protein